MNVLCKIALIYSMPSVVLQEIVPMPMMVVQLVHCGKKAKHQSNWEHGE